MAEATNGKKQQGKPVPVEWVGMEDAPVVFVNNILAQHTENEFIVTFGYIQPPVVLKESDLESIEKVACKAVVRLAVSPGNLPDFVRVLSQNLAKYSAKHQDEE